MNHDQLNDPLTRTERLAVFRFFGGAPFAGKRAPDLTGVAGARAFSVGSAGSNWKPDCVPLGVVHLEVLDNPDDGVHETATHKSGFIKCPSPR